LTARKVIVGVLAAVGALAIVAAVGGAFAMASITLRQHGTNMYHSHHDEMTRIGMGMTGLFVIHPRKPARIKIDRDFAIMLHEWRIDVGTSRPNPNEVTEFNRTRDRTKQGAMLSVVNVLDAEYAYRIANGFNGSHYAPGRSIYLRLGALL